eukprot:489787_1
MTTIPGSLNRIKMKSKRQPSQCDHYSGNHSCTQSSNAQCTYNGDCDTLRRIGIDAKSPTRTIAPSTSMTSSVSPIIHLKTITVTQAIARSHTFTILWLLFIEFCLFICSRLHLSNIRTIPCIIHILQLAIAFNRNAAQTSQNIQGIRSFASHNWCLNCLC